MTLKTRIIPCLDVKDGRVVKGVQFVDLVDAGDPVEAAIAYDAAGADELCFLDITASPEGRDTIFDVVARTAEHCFMPVTVGGGIRKLEDIRKLLLSGADKVSINTAAVNDPDFVARAADKFGDQCIVVSVDARQRRTQAVGGHNVSEWEIFTHGGRTATGHRCGGVCGADGRARGGRAARHLDGPRRHQVRLRSPADPRHRRCGARAGDRLGRRRHARRSGRRREGGARERGACRLDLPLRHLHDCARPRRYLQQHGIAMRNDAGDF